MGQHGLGIDFAQALDHGVFEQKALIRKIHLLAIRAVTLIAAIVEPEIILVVAGAVLCLHLLHVFIYHLQSSFGRRAAVVVRHPFSLLVHTEVLGVLGEKFARKHPSHTVLLVFEVYAHVDNLLLEFIVLRTLVVLAEDADGVHTGLFHHTQPVDYRRVSSNVVPSHADSAQLEVRLAVLLPLSAREQEKTRGHHNHQMFNSHHIRAY